MSRIYSATYSNVPVYEYTVDGTAVMRRRADSWINATHILKVAAYDKPARTRILEREVQKNTHEKVQGGYGKYQGTWIPLEDGRALADRCGCLEKLLPMLNFVAGDRSPPPAPKHQTAAASRPKAPRTSAAAQKAQAKAPVARRNATEAYQSSKANHHSRASELSFDRYSSQPQQEDAMSVGDQMTLSSESDGETYGYSSRKRKRGAEQPQVMSVEDQQHLMWSDELLDYFMLQRAEEPVTITVPVPPPDVDLNRAVDEKGNTALHWAAAMGDLQLVTDFIQRGAKIDALTVSAATPLMHAVTFTNNADKQTMVRLVEYLYPTVGQRDCCLSTVFHHIVASTMSKSKYPIARYYLQCILDRLKQAYDPHNIAMLLDVQDMEGNTAALLAAKFGARKCTRLLTAHGTNINIPNNQGETAAKYIGELNQRRQDRARQGSSSPLLPPNGLSQHDPPSLTLQASTSSQTRAQHFASEAASMLASQLPTLITSRAEALATALDGELAERDLEAREAERLLQQRRQELYILRQRTATLRGLDVDEAIDEAQQAELEELMVESRRLLEAEQSDALKRLIAEAEAASKPLAQASGGEAEARQKLALARELQAAQTQRKRLVADVVAAQGLAGAGGARQDAYKRLITSALGVRTEDVETMLPEMLAELEEARAGVDLSPTEDGGALDGKVQRLPVSVQS